jgi:hypothetical protein
VTAAPMPIKSLSFQERLRYLDSDRNPNGRRSFTARLRTLFAWDIALSGLNGCLSQKKLDLFEFGASVMGGRMSAAGREGRVT